MERQKRELSFQGLRQIYYSRFIKNVVEEQILGMNAIAAHLIFKDCIAELSRHLSQHAPWDSLVESEDVKPKAETFYAPAVKIATLLHRAGWNTWLRHNIPPASPRYILPTKVERLKRRGEQHLGISPFKEIIAEGERTVYGRGGR